MATSFHHEDTKDTDHHEDTKDTENTKSQRKTHIMRIAVAMSGGVDSSVAAALLVDLLFSGATFCKYLCPIGQFNFIASTMSPLELQIREESTCRACRTADCIKGRWEPDVAQTFSSSPQRTRGTRRNIPDGLKRLNLRVLRVLRGS